MINSIRQCNTFQYDTVRIAPCLFSRSMCFTQCVCVRVGGCVRRRAFECIGALLMGCLLHLRSFGNHFFHFFPFHSIVCQVICKFVWQSWESVRVCVRHTITQSQPQPRAHRTHKYRSYSVSVFCHRQNSRFTCFYLIRFSDFTQCQT